MLCKHVVSKRYKTFFMNHNCNHCNMKFYCMLMVLCVFDVSIGEYHYPVVHKDAFIKYKYISVDESVPYLEKEVLRSLEECVSRCITFHEDCLSISAQINGTEVECAYYDDDSPELKSADNSSSCFLTRKELRCSGFCSANGKHICGPCKCYDACGLKGRTNYHCNCTQVAPTRASCQAYYEAGINISGVYAIKPGNNDALHVFCQMEKEILYNPVFIQSCDFTWGKIDREHFTLFDRGIDIEKCHADCMARKIIQPKIWWKDDNDEWDHALLDYTFVQNYTECLCSYGTSFHKSNDGVDQFRQVIGTHEFQRGTYSSASHNHRIFGDLTEEGCLQQCFTVRTHREGYILSAAYQENGRRCYCVYGVFKPSFPANVHRSGCSIFSNVPLATKSHESVIVMMSRWASNADYWRKSKRDYINGFGDTNDLWIGLNALHRITAASHTNVRADYTLKDGTVISTLYKDVKVSGADDKYRMTYNEYDDRMSTEPSRVFENNRKFYHCAYWWQRCEKPTPANPDHFGFANEISISRIQIYLYTYPRDL